MKKVILFSVMILLFIFILVGITQAFQNEPEGFRGVKWGDPPGKDMEFSAEYMVFNVDDLIWYERKNDKFRGSEDSTFPKWNVNNVL